MNPEDFALGVLCWRKSFGHYIHEDEGMGLQKRKDERWKNVLSSSQRIGCMVLLRRYKS